MAESQLGDDVVVDEQQLVQEEDVAVRDRRIAQEQRLAVDRRALWGGGGGRGAVSDAPVYSLVMILANRRTAVACGSECWTAHGGVDKGC